MDSQYKLPWYCIAVLLCTGGFSLPGMFAFHHPLGWWKIVLFYLAYCAASDLITWTRLWQETGWKIVRKTAADETEEPEE